MPELPDITVYIEALTSRVGGAVLQGVNVYNAFLLRTADPPLQEAAGRRVLEVRRVGKRIVFALEGELFLVLHLMIAGRLRWDARREEEGTDDPKRPKRAKPTPEAAAASGAAAKGTAITAGKRPGGRIGLATFGFSTGVLLLTEAGTRKRASLHLVQGESALRALDPGGLEVLTSGPDEFRVALTRANHTLKRALTDPRLFSGIGNSYSDEILFRARLSPFRQTRQLDEEEIRFLHQACCDVLREWTDRLRAESAPGFPVRVTAFRPEMAVHGRYRLPCPVCHSPVQRIVYAENEANYCARCQTGGRLLADRSLSRLLKSDWPKTIDELEQTTVRKA